MSIKKHFEELKGELSQEEKFFEQAIKVERFFNRYKLRIITVVSLLIILLIGNGLYLWNENRRILVANEAYTKLQNDPNDASAILILKENSSMLYSAFRYSRAIEMSDLDELEALNKEGHLVFSDLARYEIATIKQSIDLLNSYSYEQSAIMKELAILNEALLLIKRGSITEAKMRLALIGDESPLANHAKLLQHYGVNQ